MYNDNKGDAIMKYSEAKECVKELGREGLEELIKRLGEEAVQAGLSLGISPDDLEEAYSGQYSSDVDFAQDMAEQLGAIDKNAIWPTTCIDWKHAAGELMYDYSEENGHYFRNI
jgi:antirestriction protein